MMIIRKKSYPKSKSKRSSKSKSKRRSKSKSKRRSKKYRKDGMNLNTLNFINNYKNIIAIGSITTISGFLYAFYKYREYIKNLDNRNEQFETIKRVYKEELRNLIKQIDFENIKQIINEICLIGRESYIEFLKKNKIDNVPFYKCDEIFSDTKEEESSDFSGNSSTISSISFVNSPESSPQKVKAQKAEDGSQHEVLNDDQKIRIIYNLYKYLIQLPPKIGYVIEIKEKIEKIDINKLNEPLKNIEIKNKGKDNTEKIDMIRRQISDLDITQKNTEQTILKIKNNEKNKEQTINKLYGELENLAKSRIVMQSEINEIQNQEKDNIVKTYDILKEIYELQKDIDTIDIKDTCQFINILAYVKCLKLEFEKDLVWFNYRKKYENQDEDEYKKINIIIKRIEENLKDLNESPIVTLIKNYSSYYDIDNSTNKKS